MVEGCEDTKIQPVLTAFTARMVRLAGTPGRYVGAEALEEDSEVFEEKMKRLTLELAKQFEESQNLEAEIKKNLEGIGFGGGK